MSTEGFGEVISILSNSLSGVGTLVSRGVMWCGKKMVESYETIAKNFQQEYIATPASSVKIEERQRIMIRVIEQFSNTDMTSEDSVRENANEQLAQTLSRAQASLNSAARRESLKEEYEYNTALHQLKLEISNSQGFVPTEDIIRAKQALSGSLKTIQEAYRELQHAWEETWNSTDDTQVLRTLQTQQTQDKIRLVQQELATLNMLLQQNNEAIKTKYEPRLKSIEEKTQRAQQRIGSDPNMHDPQKALEDAQQAQKDLQTVKQTVTHTLAEEWDKQIQELAEAKGRLKALETMIQDAISEQVVPSDVGNSLLQEEMATCRKQIEEAESEPERDKVVAVFEEIDQLAQQTFRTIGEGQQYKIANIVASTFGELGFISNPTTKAAPLIEKMGASVRVLGFQNERITTFYIDRDGGISYDFSGYKGSECTEMANRIFSALRKKGLIVVDAAGAEKVDQYSLSSLSPEILQDNKFLPQFDINKRQTIIHAQILQILQDKMGFTQILQNSSGGSIVIDAFHDQIGYHVVLSSEGKATLTRHNSDKNAEDTEDQLQIALSSPLLSSQSSLPIEPPPLEQTTREVLPERPESKSRQAQEEDELRDSQGDIISESDMS